ncbi:cobalamin biosynthesis protein [Methanobrevibacter sp. TMH8]|uniref:cobalt-precorrin 5A hydrolase n=1 Tax=Methanobrevibacter sp. TMH8 TaxID=2848611 RepID=UPI001CCDB9C5|nr:cobalamin biosynthesis protein [Methanobrevibacter sp. TMH8]MBZ9570479.1 cobalamin biosynthesis protein [Methanobrevibacter sp. TMH8]
MKIAILSVSKKGKKLSSKLKSLLDEDPTVIKVSCFHKNVKDNIDFIFNENIQRSEYNSYNGIESDKYDAIIGIMATGILIRNIADKLKDKTIDPAILSLDDNGKYVISLVSGHLGGANGLTKKIANLLNSEPVITTATDTNDKIGIDTLAMKLHWKILNKKEILAFNKAILEGKVIKIFINLFNKDNIEYKHYIDNYLKIKEKNTLEITDLKESNLSIEDIKSKIFYLDSDKDNKYPNQDIYNKYKNCNIVASFDNHRMFFKPKMVVVGIGARANISKEKVMNAINIAMKNLDLPLDRIDFIATVEIKKDEKGILESVKDIGKDLKIVTIDEIKKFKDSNISKSEFVQEKFDIPGVAEPTALIVAKNGTADSKLIHKKIAIDGVTVAIAISD